jgi:Anti-sigma factor NepR
MKLPRPKKTTGEREPVRPPAAFDLWLQRGLHQMFDDVAREPIPEELLKLIEDDRKK